MKQKRWGAIYAALLGALALLAVIGAAMWMADSKAKEEAKPEYILRDNAGRVALYAGDGSGPLAEYNIYTRLLPQADVLALQQGVPVQNDTALQRLLEDYGL